MSRFKVGDRIKDRRRYFDVLAIDGDTYVLRKCNGDVVWWWIDKTDKASLLELVGRAEEQKSIGARIVNLLRSLRDMFLRVFRIHGENNNDDELEWWAPKFQAGDYLRCHKDSGLPDYQRDWYKVVRLLSREYLLEDSDGNQYTQSFKFADKRHSRIIPIVVTKVDREKKSITFETAPPRPGEKIS